MQGFINGKICGQQMYQNVCTVNVKSKMVYTQFNKSLNSKSFNREMHSQKVTKLGSQKLHLPKSDLDWFSLQMVKKISYMYNGWGSEKLAAHTQQTLTQVTSPFPPRAHLQLVLSPLYLLSVHDLIFVLIFLYCSFLKMFVFQKLDPIW